MDTVGNNSTANEPHNLALALRDWFEKSDGITIGIPSELAQAIYSLLNGISTEDQVPGRAPEGFDAWFMDHHELTSSEYAKLDLYWSDIKKRDLETWQAGTAYAAGSGTPFSRLTAGTNAVNEMTNGIEKLMGIELLGLSWDTYDDSLEIYTHSATDFRATDEQHAAILAYGCNQYWINFKDRTERHGQGDKHASASNRWDQYDRSIHPDRRMALKGWVLYSADFSIQSKDPLAEGSVTLIRDIAGQEAFRLMPDTQRAAFDLYLSGKGMTINEAIANAFTSLKNKEPK